MRSIGITDQRERKKQQVQAAAFYSSVARKQVQRIQLQGQMPACGIYS